MNPSAPEDFTRESIDHILERWPLIAAIDAQRAHGGQWRIPARSHSQAPIRQAGHRVLEPPVTFPSFEVNGPPFIIVAVLGAKGGVGRTTTTANIAAGLAYGGLPTLVLDLDPQNALISHFGIWSNGSGVARSTLQGASWRTIPQRVESRRPDYQGAYHLQVLPYGVLDDADISAFECMVSLDPHWLNRHIGNLGLVPSTVVVVDLPAQSSAVVQHVLNAAHVAIAVSLVDAASYLCLARNEALIRKHCLPRRNFVRHCHVFNQIDHSLVLEADLTKLLRALFQGSVAAFVHRDQSVREALAWHTTVFEYQPGGQATHDYTRATEFVAHALSVHYGHLTPPRFV